MSDLDAAKTAAGIAALDKGGPAGRNLLLASAERAVVRTLVSRLLRGGEPEFWRLVEVHIKEMP